MAVVLPMVFLKRALFPLVLFPGLVGAGMVEGDVRNAEGGAVIEAVVNFEPLGGPVQFASVPGTVTMDQVDREFVSHVLPVRVGTAVRFPNSDKIKHHVYSFSPARRFEIKLYSGTPASPVVFDKPGVVTLGCNIHDWMVGYIYVTAAPYFAQTDRRGHWSTNVPDGRYRVTIWHPDATGPQVTTLDLGRSPHPLSHVLALKVGRRTGKPPRLAQEQGYSGDP